MPGEYVCEAASLMSYIVIQVILVCLIIYAP